MKLPLLAAACGLALSAPAQAGEVFAGAYVHEVDTPFTFDVNEGGTDIQLGYRFAPIEALGFIGKPAPYLIGSVNTAGDTSFGGIGLAWTIGKGPVYVRPGVGLVVHDGPSNRVDLATMRHTELGSRVLFEPEIALGARLSQRVSLEASWVHISQARLFNSRQNPGIDIMGVRLNYAL
ncbi:acyloxyacyl hydrolase [Tsuneonella sp. HG222]